MDHRHQQRPVNILLIEDNPGDAHLVKTFLTDGPECYRIDTADSLVGGMASLRSGRIYDLLLLDLSLPDSAGEMETVRKIRTLTDRIPIVVLTGLQDEAIAEDLIREGIQDYFLKSDLGKVPLDRTIRHARERQKLLLALQEANQKIQRQQQQMIDEERVKILLQLSGSTAHDLHQPLAVLTGFIELAEEDIDDPQALKDYLAGIKAACHRITAMISRLDNVDLGGFPSSVSTSNTQRLDEKVNILSVEDTDEDFSMLERALDEEPKARLHRATTMAEGLVCVQQQSFHVILLDHQLPDGDGFQFMDRLQAAEIDVPVIIITRQGNEMVAAKFLKTGVSDYLPKDAVSRQSLVRSIYNAVTKHRLQKEIREAHAKLSKLSTIDELTGLYNRRWLMEMLENELSRSVRYGEHLSIGLLDIDHFKPVNDTHGHVFGDTILRAIGRLVADSIREVDTAFRYGGEELVIIMPETDLKAAGHLCQRLCRTIADTPLGEPEKTIAVTVSVGVACFEKDPPDTALSLIEKADKALYRAKADGRNRVVYYRPADGGPPN